MSYKYLRGKTYKVTFALGAGATVQVYTVQYNRLVATTYNLEVVYSTREKYRQALRPFLCPKIFLWWVKIKKLSLQYCICLQIFQKMFTVNSVILSQFCRVMLRYFDISAQGKIRESLFFSGANVSSIFLKNYGCLYVCFCFMLIYSMSLLQQSL